MSCVPCPVSRVPCPSDITGQFSAHLFIVRPAATADHGASQVPIAAFPGQSIGLSRVHGADQTAGPASRLQMRSSTTQVIRTVVSLSAQQPTANRGEITFCRTCRLLVQKTNAFSEDMLCTDVSSLPRLHGRRLSGPTAVLVPQQPHRGQRCSAAAAEGLSDFPLSPQTTDCCVCGCKREV